MFLDICRLTNSISFLRAQNIHKKGNFFMVFDRDEVDRLGKRSFYTSTIDDN